MRKVIVIIAIIVIIGASIFAGIYINDAKKKEEEELNKHITLIDINELKEKVENKDDFILIMTQTSCGFCESYLPVFKKVLRDYDLYVYQIHTDLIEENEDKAFMKDFASISGTPTTIFVKDGQEVSALNRIVGNRSRSYTIDKLKSFGYIKE